jgi:hypothetical protein
MIVPELLVVGVIPPPPPYLPPFPLLFWLVPPVEEVVVDSLVLLPQAAKMTTSAVNIRILHKVRVLACEVKGVLLMVFYSFASGNTCNQNELSNDIYVLKLRVYFSET